MHDEEDMNRQEVALLAVALIFLCDLVERIFGQRQAARIQRQQDHCTAEAAQLQKQAERLSAPSTFAQSAKLSRKAVALEKEAAGLQQSKELVLSSLAVRAARAIRTAASLALVFWLWGRPALFLEGRALWPITRILTSQHAAAPGGIVAMSTIATLAVARRASSAIAAVLAP